MRRHLGTIFSTSALFILLLVAMGGAFAYHVLFPEPRSNFWDNVVATLVGLIAGIAVTWFTSRLGHSREEVGRKRKILTLLREEIDHNHKVTAYLKTANNPTPQDMLLHRVSSEVWDAFSKGGELEWIDDTHLLNTLANTYSVTRPLESIQDTYVDRKTENRNHEFYRQVLEDRAKTMDHIFATALNAIDQSLGMKN